MIQCCPMCRRMYETVLNKPEGDNRPVQQIFPKAPAWQREQLITGICSNRCWEEMTGVQK